MMPAPTPSSLFLLCLLLLLLLRPSYPQARIAAATGGSSTGGGGVGGASSTSKTSDAWSTGSAAQESANKDAGNYLDKLSWVYTQPENWYSPSDLCIIRNWRAEDGLTLLQVRKDKCGLPSQADEWEGKLSIGYGSSYSATCTPPLTSRPQYLQALAGFNDPTSKHLLEAVKEIHMLNRTLVFFGDSVMRQNFVAFLAEIKRLDRRIVIDRWGNSSEVPSQYVNTFHHLHDDNDGAGALLWLNPHEPPMPIYQISCHHLDGGRWERGQNMIKQIQSQSKGIVALINMGLHYNDRALQFSALSLVLKFFSEFADSTTHYNTVLWRETTAQHFEFRAQGYWDADRAFKHHHCVPHGLIKPTNPNDELDWRNADAKSIFQIYGIKNIAYIPFYKATEPLFAMHPERDKLPIDCTHFCWLPTLWQPIWRALADSVSADKIKFYYKLTDGGGPGATGASTGKSNGPSAGAIYTPGEPVSVPSSPTAAGVENPTPWQIRSKLRPTQEPTHVGAVKTPGGTIIEPVPHYIDPGIDKGKYNSTNVDFVYTLKIITAKGAVIRNGIDIDASTVTGKLQKGTIIKAFRAVPIAEEDQIIIRYQIEGGGWISSNLRDATHDSIVEILTDVT